MMHIFDQKFREYNGPSKRRAVWTPITRKGVIDAPCQPVKVLASTVFLNYNAKCKMQNMQRVNYKKNEFTIKCASLEASGREDAIPTL